MAIYGNSGGRNRGKKYARLRGDETPTPEGEARAREFMTWYSQNEGDLRAAISRRSVYDPEICSDVFLHIYERLAIGRIAIRDFKFYFIRTYHTARLSAMVAKRRAASRSVSVESCNALEDHNEVSEAERTCQLAADIMHHVRTHYSEEAASLFEMYTAEGERTSYRELGEITGKTARYVQSILGPIRAEVGRLFVNRMGYSAIFRVKNGVVLSYKKNN